LNALTEAHVHSAEQYCKLIDGYGEVRSFDWLVSSTLKSKPDIEDGFAELFHEKYLCIKINKNNV